MSNLQYRQEKIQSKRKQTPWRNFVMEICSRNAYNLYKNNGAISIYPPTDKIKVTPFTEYEKERDQIIINSPDVGNDSFFNGVQSLFQNIGMPTVLGFFDKENADYANIVISSKNIYISFGVIGCENVIYTGLAKDGSTDVCDSLSIYDNSSVVYRSVSIYKSHKIFYSKNIFESSDIWFSTNLQGCHECILCNNLQHQSYCIDNKQLSKEEYYQKKGFLLLQKGEFNTKLRSHPLMNIGSKNCKGIGILLSEDIEDGYLTYQLKSCRNVIFTGSVQGNEELYDVHHFGSPSGNRAYGVCGGGSGVEHLYCSSHVNGGSNVYYSYYLENCSFCLGCVGLKNKEFCILNKQYTKEERYEKVDEIFAQMERDGTLGEFFPASMNPFYFNDTAAYLIDNSFTKEEVTTKGYLWRDEPIKVDIPEGVKVVKTSELDQYEGFVIVKEGNGGSNPSGLPIEWIATPTARNDVQWYIDPEILKCIIQDEQGNVYKIVKMEYDFLVKYGLPLPRKHWLDRMKENFKIQ